MSSRGLSVSHNPAQYRRGLGITEVEGQKEGLLHDGQVGSGQEPGECSRASRRGG